MYLKRCLIKTAVIPANTLDPRTVRMNYLGPTWDIQGRKKFNLFSRQEYKGFI